MKKGFLSEVKRLDNVKTKEEQVSLYDAHIDDYEWIPTNEEYLSMINETLAGRLALKLDDEKNNRYCNSHQWEFYYDFYNDNNDWQDSPFEESDFAFCLVRLEKDNILSLEARKLFKNRSISDENYLEEFEKFQIDYRRTIINECYKNGNFETENWKIKVRHLRD
ncbi:hypothetical protein I4641_19975 [Waterburya agarophytonicola K14]|uniref:Uncharacterized protein n=1 Tax=Waterburya agarophytonicola KI4 TaxID=2874699 RepID=A0A964FGR7_9CYAN|nr:hypothetical protein [Waterburya agarophytonicola]MCC0179245.1 hypothetical protein [Waterburya agarophytonicola KI4]